MASPTLTHCPECSAPVKTGDKQCWMCFRLLQWDRGAVQAVTAANFAERPSLHPRTYYRTNPWAIVGIVLAALAMIPAACIAFFVTCFAGFMATEGRGGTGDPYYVIIPVSWGAALVVIVGFCVLIGMLGKRISRPVQN